METIVSNVNGYKQRVFVGGENQEITSALIITALGYTPYDASNPSGFISGISGGMVITALGYTPASTSGSYSNPSWITSLAWSKISATPTTLSGYSISDAQPTLVSGSNIKTINGSSILGSGDLIVSSAVQLSSLTGAISTNSITNASNAQTWAWSLTSTTNALTITDSSAASGTGYLLSVGTTTGTSLVKPFRITYRTAANPLLDTTATGGLTIRPGASGNLVTTTNSITNTFFTDAAGLVRFQAVDSSVVSTFEMGGGTYDSGFFFRAFTQANSAKDTLRLSSTFNGRTVSGNILNITNTQWNNGGTGLAITLVSAANAGTTYGTRIALTGNSVNSIAGSFSASGATTNNFAIEVLAGNISLSSPAGCNMILDTTVGLKIGTSTLQKIAFYNATPVVQQTGGAATASASYSTNEQNMLQTLWNMARTMGLLS